MTEYDTIILREHISLDSDYLAILDTRERDGRIPTDLWPYVKKLVAMKHNRGEAARLTIRLHILQAFVHEHCRELTYSDLRSYWLKSRRIPKEVLEKNHKLGWPDINAMADKGDSPNTGRPLLIRPSGSRRNTSSTRTDRKAVKPHQISSEQNEELCKIADTVARTEIEKLALAKVRLTQSAFRSAVVQFWRMCSITRVDSLEYLVASHIKPWRHSDDLEKLDYQNGLLLAPNADKLFDIGHITFDDSGRIILSEALLASKELERLGLASNMSLVRDMPERMKVYMAYHRENVFCK